jgi:hypothetical protein
MLRIHTIEPGPRTVLTSSMARVYASRSKASGSTSSHPAIAARAHAP